MKNRGDDFPYFVAVFVNFLFVLAFMAVGASKLFLLGIFVVLGFFMMIFFTIIGFGTSKNPWFLFACISLIVIGSVVVGTFS